MLNVIEMPHRSDLFGSVLACLPLRIAAFEDDTIWLGQNGTRGGQLERSDHEHSFHLIMENEGLPYAYCRLSPVYCDETEVPVSSVISDVAMVSRRLPAHEMQLISLPRSASVIRRVSVLQDLLAAAFKIGRRYGSSFVYTSCDEAGRSLIRKTGVRFSTLSDIVDCNNRAVKVICMRPTAEDFQRLSRFHLVRPESRDNNVFRF